MSIIERAMEKARQAAITTNAGMPYSRRNDSSSISSHPERSRRSHSSSWTASPPSLQVSPVPELIMAGQDSLQGGAYQLLKQSLLAYRKKYEPMSLFMVTSAMRNEGKTMVANNLAVTLAYEYDIRVMLIDGDLRAPCCHKMMGLKREKGLSDILLHGVPFNEVLIHTGLGRLSLIGAGSPIEKPDELFTSELMSNFLDEVRTRYRDRIVIIDTVPLLPFPESRALSQLVDGIILVARENVTAKAHLDDVLRELEGLPLLGVVYNDASSYGTDREVFELPYAY